MQAGSVIKAFAIYPEPFWRQDGLNGQAASDTGPVKVTFDNSPPSGTPGVLMGFLEGNQARSWARRSPADRREAVIRCFVRYFGPAAARPVQYVERDWMAEEYTRGCYGAHFAPGVWTAYGQAWRAPIGRIHWAGTECAPQWNGYMEGAVRSGEAAASGRRTVTLRNAARAARVDARVKKIGFLSFGHWSASPGSQTRSASDALLQSIDLAVAAEELGADGAYFRVHHFARQLGSPFPLLAAVGARTSRIEIGTAVIDMRYENPLYMAEDAGAADVISGGRLQLGISRGSPEQVIDGWRYFGYQPQEGQTDADMARGHAQVLLDVLRGEGFAQPSPRPMFPNPPGLLRVEPHSEGCGSASGGVPRPRRPPPGRPSWA